MIRFGCVVGALAVALACRAAAEGSADDPAKGTWRIDSSATTQSVPQGQKGKVGFSILTKEGAHVSAEAPLKIELKSSGVKLDKTALANADAIDAKSGHPRFEVPFVADQKGSQQIDANLTFFVCTDKWCIRQKDTLTLKVDVR
jgi:hypothetical protein